jgi:cell division protein FtsW
MPSPATLTVPRLRVARPGELSPAAARARADRGMRRVLTVLVVSVAALTLAGLVMVLSASSITAFAQYGSSFTFFKRQAFYTLVGAAGAVAAARLRYQVWRRLWRPILGLTGILLVLVLHPSFGTVSGGASRWIAIGSFSMQPSEFAKFGVITAAAAILARNVKHLDEPWRWAVPLLLLVGVFTALILLQPDLGTTTVLVLAVFSLLFVAGVRLRYLLAWAVVASGAGLALIMGEGYRRARLFSFLHPWSDPRNTGYQIVQSLIALGSGHLFGVGLGASRQKWMYMPNAHTDFIFAILGEELGLIGELVVLALFATFVYAGVRIALKAPDAFGRLLAAGITAWLGAQAVVNLGAVTGVLPITGVPLPFVSFGGSSLIVSLGAVGVLFSIGRAGMRGAKRPRNGRSSADGGSGDRGDGRGGRAAASGGR